jgi:hypothetical protein
MQETETVLSVIREPITRKVITGEPVMGKLIRRVREGADGKGPVLRAPRRRPTSLDGGDWKRGTRPRTRRRTALWETQDHQRLRDLPSDNATAPVSYPPWEVLPDRDVRSSTAHQHLPGALGAEEIQTVKGI